jgi:hypothetical protein
LRPRDWLPPPPARARGMTCPPFADAPTPGYALPLGASRATPGLCDLKESATQIYDPDGGPGPAL